MFRQKLKCWGTGKMVGDKIETVNKKGIKSKISQMHEFFMCNRKYQQNIKNYSFCAGQCRTVPHQLLLSPLSVEILFPMTREERRLWKFFFRNEKGQFSSRGSRSRKKTLSPWGTCGSRKWMKWKQKVCYF